MSVSSVAIEFTADRKNSSSVCLVRPTRQYRHMLCDHEFWLFFQAFEFRPSGGWPRRSRADCRLDEASPPKRDLWGEAAMRQPMAQAMIFENLLPPPRL